MTCLIFCGGFGTRMNNGEPGDLKPLINVAGKEILAHIISIYESQGIQSFTDGTFTIDEAKLSYIRKMAYMHNAQDFGTLGYAHPSGVTLTGTVNCDLPDHTHREIVDIAVMLAASEVQTSDLQVKASKLGFNQIV